MEENKINVILTYDSTNNGNRCEANLVRVPKSIEELLLQLKAQAISDICPYVMGRDTVMENGIGYRQKGNLIPNGIYHVLSKNSTTRKIIEELALS